MQKARGRKGILIGLFFPAAECVPSSTLPLALSDVHSNASKGKLLV